jgi:hypothetical protein
MDGTLGGALINLRPLASVTDSKARRFCYSDAYEGHPHAPAVMLAATVAILEGA